MAGSQLDAYLAQLAKNEAAKKQGFGVSETVIPGGITVTGAPQPAAQPPTQSPSYLADPDAWINQYYGDGYSRDAGATTIGSDGKTTISHTKMTPETHPWAFIGSNEADVNGRVYGSGTTRTGTGYTAGRQASEAERQASYDANNYYRNGNEGLDPALLEAMTRYITPGQTPGDQYTNQYGTYTQQHAIIDERRKALGLDPWVEVASQFSGVDQQGNPVNYTNQDSLWGNRGPGMQVSRETAKALGYGGGGGASGYGGPTPEGRKNPDWKSQLPTGTGATPENRGWANSGQFIDRSTVAGDYGNQTVGSPAMAALKAAMMGGGFGK